jgi:ketosteroid isomerase-like protein
MSPADRQPVAAAGDAQAGDPAGGRALEEAVRFFEHIAPSDVARIHELYSADAWFKDPFNEVRGTDAIAGIFEHMFEALESPRFVVHERIAHGAQAFLTWDFHFRLRGGRPAGEQTIRGATLLRFDARGRIFHHRDYWDAAEELYEKLPVLGAFMRGLKRRANRRA